MATMNMAEHADESLIPNPQSTLCVMTRHCASTHVTCMRIARRPFHYDQYPAGIPSDCASQCSVASLIVLVPQYLPEVDID